MSPGYVRPRYARTPPFEEGLRDLLEMASRQTCAIMCAEGVSYPALRREPPCIVDRALADG